MTLIDSTYFHDRTFIPNLTGTMGGTGEGGKAERIAKLNRYIEQYEKEYLLKLLGKTVYLEFKTWIDNQDETEKWVDLKAELLDETLKLSPIANYVFVKLWEDTCTPRSGVGSTVSKSTETSIVLDPSYDIVKVWNEVVEWNRFIALWIAERYDTYYANCTESSDFAYSDNSLEDYRNSFGL